MIGRATCLFSPSTIRNRAPPPGRESVVDPQHYNASMIHGDSRKQTVSHGEKENYIRTFYCSACSRRGSAGVGYRREEGLLLFKFFLSAVWNARKVRLALSWVRCSKMYTIMNISPFYFILKCCCTTPNVCTNRGCEIY